MKKTYCTPSLKALKIETSNLLDSSPITGPGEGSGNSSDNRFLDSKAFSSDIWGSMNSNEDKTTDEDEE